MDSQQASGTIVQIVINNKHKHGQGKEHAPFVPHPQQFYHSAPPPLPRIWRAGPGKGLVSHAYQKVTQASLTIKPQSESVFI